MSILQIISLGNDIVDLYDHDTVYLLNNKKFLKRVFRESELDYLSQLKIDNQNIYLWKLWAAKESAYKAIKRLRSDVIFSPRRFYVSSDLARVNYDDVDFFVEFKENNRYLHASSYYCFPLYILAANKRALLFSKQNKVLLISLSHMR